MHSFPVWLPQTQTWMYNQVIQLQLQGIETHVVCDSTKNPDQFTVANIHSLEDEPLIRQKIWEKGLRKLRIRPYLTYLVETGKKVDADIIHSHFGNVGWANLGAVRKLKVKHVVTFYGQDVNKLPMQNPVWRKRYRQLFSEVDLVLCEGVYMANCVMELGCPDHKVKVQHLGVDVDSIAFQPRQWCADEPLRVLMAASFREKKGIPYAIEALQLVAREIPVQLTIIGDAGTETDSKREKVRILSALERSGLKKNTRLLGFQTHQAMLQEAYDHHLFLQPSITAEDGDTEGGAPVSIIEMLATGMPVVSTGHCDIPEVVGEAYAHLLAPERDVAKLTECILMLLGEVDSWPALVQKGRRHIEREYDWSRQAKCLADCYNDIL